MRWWRGTTERWCASISVTAAIEASHAEEFQKFYTASFNPYLNYHRPCGFATVTHDRRGRRQRRYRAQDYQTPYEKLSSLADWQKHLKPGIKAEQLERESAGV